MNFSVTERGSFFRCQRKALLTSKNGWHLTPLASPLHLSVGSLIHRAHQLWLLNPNKRLPDHAIQASGELLEWIKHNYVRATGTSPSDAEMRTTHDAISIALEMCENYQLRWGKPLPDEYELLGAEQKIQVPVPGTEHTCKRCEGTGQGVVTKLTGELHGFAVHETCPMCGGTGTALHCLEGRLDALLRHKPTGRVDVLERKTYNTRPKEDALKTNDQFMGYRWLVWKLSLSDRMPSVLYDGSWRRGAVPRGRVFNDLFLRVILDCNRSELEEFDRFLPHELNAMYHMYQNPVNAYKNRQWQGCWDCGVEKICRKMSRGEDHQALIRLEYAERTDDLDGEDSDSE